MVLVEAKPAPDEEVAATLAQSPRAIRDLSFRRRTTLQTGEADVALHSEEAARASQFGLIIAVLCGIALLCLPFQDVPLWLDLAMAITLAGQVVLGVWMWQRARNANKYNNRVFRVFTITSAIAGLVVVYYGGFFSAAPVVIVLGISFIGLGDDRAFGLVLCIGFIAAYMLVGALIAANLIPEYSIVSLPYILLPAKVFTIVVTGACFSVTLWNARAARRATRGAVEKLAQALGQVREREALLDEAHRNLDQALKADAGRSGRFTGARAGEYFLAELIGRGAMGEVYEATHSERGTRAAVKVVADAAQDNPKYLERFSREAKITSKLDAPNVVKVLDVGNLADKVPYIVMELLIGHDLAWHLRRQRKLAPREVERLVFETARGLSAAHQAGIIHRDIKPNNLFLHEPSQVSTWKVLDFGISKVIGSNHTLTQGAVVGTPGYMSPEQAKSRPATVTSDVFSLAAVAYRALTGRPPFTGPDTPQILYHVVHLQPHRPSQNLEDLGDRALALDAVFAIAFAKRPEDRFQSAEEFSEAFVAAGRGELPDALMKRGAQLIENHPWGRPAKR